MSKVFREPHLLSLLCCFTFLWLVLGELSLRSYLRSPSSAFLIKKLLFPLLAVDKHCWAQFSWPREGKLNNRRKQVLNYSSRRAQHGTGGKGSSRCLQFLHPHHYTSMRSCHETHLRPFLPALHLSFSWVTQRLKTGFSIAGFESPRGM